MKKSNKTNDSAISLDLLRELYESARLRRADECEAEEKYMRQYLGSDEIDGSAEPALTVRNITYEIIESEINSSVPYPRVEPGSYSKLHENSAAAAERLCRTLRSKLEFEALNDRDERYTYIYGGSVWYVEWDSYIYPDGGVRVHCLPPSAFLPQPGVTDISRMEYCFLTFSTTKGELVRRYGTEISELHLAECELSSDTEGTLSDRVRLVIAFYKDSYGDVGRVIFSGELLLSEEPKYYKRKGAVCRRCSSEMGECECGAGYKIGDIIFEKLQRPEGEITLPYYTPREFPIVIRRSGEREGSLFGISDCMLIRPAQQAINKIESRILSKLIRSAVTPVMPEDAGVSVTNAIFGQVIKLRPGESAESYGKIDTTPDISADIAEADRLYDQARRIIGISDALQGTDSVKSESGYARQLRISQASGRLEPKRRLKNAAYAKLYSLIFKHYLAFCDQVKTVEYKDALGRRHTADFSRHDFIELDDKGYFFCDDYSFSADESGERGYAREALWERNIENLNSGSLGDKSTPETLLTYWQLQERAGYPFASAGVEYFKALIENKNTKEGEDQK